MATIELCRCGSGIEINSCCGGIIAGRKKALTAEQLMRSRYTAYVIKNVNYLVETTAPSERTDDLESDIRTWMRKVDWLKLHVVATEQGGENDTMGYVEFVAEYLSPTAPGRHHECSVFHKIDGQWYYLGEETEPHQDM